MVDRVAVESSVSTRENKIGLLRLLFASLVVFGHSFDLIGHDVEQTWAVRFARYVPMGEIGVDGFFIVSGYLITKSWLSQQTTTGSYLRSRILRIYPGYVVAYLISFYLVGHLAGGDISGGLGLHGLFYQLAHMGLLLAPDVPSAFSGQPYTLVNGSMWSLAQEFRCYIMVMLLGALALYRRPAVLLSLLAVALLALTVPSYAIVRMASIFFCGSAFYLFRDRIVYDGRLAAVALVLWALAMPYDHVREPLTATLGAYVIFYVAFYPGLRSLNQIGRKTDISYGIYLYSWPIAQLIIYYTHETSQLRLMAETLIPAVLAGYASWVCVERPCLALKDVHRRIRFDRGWRFWSNIERPSVGAKSVGRR